MALPFPITHIYLSWFLALMTQQFSSLMKIIQNPMMYWQITSHCGKAFPVHTCLFSFRWPTNERLADILKIENPVQAPDGIPIYDTARAFKGDHSASQFEAGQQKGGNYASHRCFINSHCIKCIPHSFKCPTINLNDRISKIHATVSSKERLKNNTVVKLYHHLDLPALIDEHQQRNIKTSCLTKQSLQATLEIEMQGIQKMPALLFTTPLAQLDNIYLDKHENLVNEPLHDIPNHLKNLQHEIPHHVPKEKKSPCKGYHYIII